MHPTNYLRAILPVLLIGLAAAPTGAQQARRQETGTQAISSLTSTRESLLISYSEGSTARVGLAGTMRLPNAKATARVRRRAGATQIEVRVDNMKPATLFGGDFSTYVLWTVSPEGLAVNAGEFILGGDAASLKTSSPLDMFGMFVTAEPHFLVSAPSRFVVLDNTGVDVARGSTSTRRVTYQGFDGVYNFERESLVRSEKVKGDNRVDRQQAAVAVRLAEQAGAREHAPEEFRQATDSLAKAMEAHKEGSSQQRISLLAHETVRLAVQSQHLADRRARAAALEAERRERQREIDSLAAAKEQAEGAKVGAEQAAARARLVADEARQAQQLALAAKSAAEDAARQAQLEQQKALQMMEQAEREAAEFAHLKVQAESEAERARREASAAHDRMQNALARVAETKETARGVIVNLPDILFDTGKSTLKPETREILSRISGILLVAPTYSLSIEGHTDSVGAQEFNQRLSERRAESVMAYLADAKVPSELMRAKGFGESKPVASNDSVEARRKNRRVEIVIGSGEIGTNAPAN